MEEKKFETPFGSSLGGYNEVEDRKNIAELQVIIVDCSNTLWLERENHIYNHESSSNGHHHSTTSAHHNSSLLSFENLIRSLLLFCNAHCLLSRDNMLCLLAHNETTCETIFPSPDLVRQHSERAFIPILTSFCDEVTQKLLSVSRLTNPDGEDSRAIKSSGNGSLAKSLSSALCSKFFNYFTNFFHLKFLSNQSSITIQSETFCKDSYCSDLP